MVIRTNDAIQWIGTAFVLGMYVISNFFPGYDTLRNSVALCGALCFFVWTVRVRNYPQMVINVVAATLCVGGLLKAFG